MKFSNLICKIRNLETIIDKNAIRTSLVIAIIFFIDRGQFIEYSWYFIKFKQSVSRLIIKTLKIALNYKRGVKD